MSKREDVVCCTPYGDTLQISAADREGVAECHIAQTQIRAILYPTVREAGVTMIIGIAYTWHICNLTLSCPAIVHSCGLVVEVLTALQYATLIVIDVIAERVSEGSIERPLLPVETSVDITVDVRIRVANNHAVSLGDNTVIVIVTNGASTKTYRVNVSKSAGE